MDYSLKVTCYLYGVSRTPCPNCPFKNEDPPVPLTEKTKKCFQRCEFKIIIWILNMEQLELFEKVRKQEKKKDDIELAINEGKIVLIIEESLRESQKLKISLPLFIN